MDEKLDAVWAAPGAKCLDSLTEFVGAVEDFTAPRENEVNRFLYRGVSNHTYPLIPSLPRLVMGDEAKRRPWLRVSMLHHIEEQATQLFQKKSPFHTQMQLQTDEEPGRLLRTWELMQHYGARTRVLDWTASPYVALYFAVVDNPQADGAVWMVDVGAHSDRIRDAFPDDIKDGKKTYVLKMPGRATQGKDYDPKPRVETADTLKRRMDLGFFPCASPDVRMSAQRGWMSFASRLDADHGEAIAMAFESKPRRWCRRITVSAAAKSRLLRSLWHMNITGETLFLGLDGLGRAVAELSDLLKPDHEHGVEFLLHGGLLESQDWRDGRPSAFPPGH